MLVGSRQKNIRQKKNRHVLLRITIGLLMVFAIASVVAIYFDQEERMERMRAQREVLDRQLLTIQAEEAVLLELSSLVDTDEYIERVARDQLGNVRPNEIVFED